MGGGESSLVRISPDCMNEREKEEGMGRVGFEPTTPAMSRLIVWSDNNNNNNNNLGGAQESKSPSAPSSQLNVQLGINPQIDWHQFHNFLLQRMTLTTAQDRLRYAKRYGSVLKSAGIPDDFLQLSPNKRIHIMKAISCLAKFTGRTDV